MQYVTVLQVVFMGGALSSAGGIGGGGIFVPLLIVVGQFTAELAVPISKAIIFGGSLCSVCILMFEKHPDADRPLIDFDAAIMLEPSALLGTIIGVYLNVFLPNWMTVALLVCVLTYTIFGLFGKGVTAMKNELLVFKKNGSSSTSTGVASQYLGKDEAYKPLVASADEEDGIGDADEPIVEIAPEEFQKQQQQRSTQVPNQSTPSAPFVTNPEDIKNAFSEENKELQIILLNERRPPFVKLLVLGLSWVIVLIISFAKGGHGNPSLIGIKPCTPWYWVMTVLPFPVLIAFSAGIAYTLIQKHNAKVRLGYKFQEGDVHWTPKNVILYPFIAAFAGCVAALVGIGGGMIKGPLLLGLGLNAHVATSTSSFMIVFTASMSCIQYFLFDRLPLDYAGLLGFTGFLASIVGQLLVGIPARRFKVTFVVIFTIAIASAIANVLLAGLGIYRLVTDIISGANMGFNPLC